MRRNSTIDVGMIPTDRYSNEVSTTDTVNHMIAVVRDSIGSPVVMTCVRQLGLDQQEDVDTLLRTVWQFVRGHLRFMEDENHLQFEGIDGFDTELVQTPDWLLSASNGDPKGDCNSGYSVLTASLLCNARQDIGVYFVTVKANEYDPNSWSHVYVAVKCPCGKVVALDTSHGPYMGWELNPHSISDKRIWTIQPAGNDFNGSGGNMLMRTPTRRDTGHGSLMGLGLIGDNGEYIPDVSGSGEVDVEGSGLPTFGNTVTETPTYQIPGASPTGSSLSNFWQQLLAGGVKTAGTIATAQYAVPPAGTYIRNADGSVVYRPANTAVDTSGNFSIPSIGGSLGSISPVILIGGGLLLLLFMGKK